jgi:hypothetical protein
MARALYGIAFTLLVVFALFTFHSPVMGGEKGDGTDWKFYKEEGGIKGYERHTTKSEYLETRADTVIEAPMEVLLTILMDIRSYPEWMHACADAIPLEQKDILHRVLYFAQDVPWPSKDRDAIIKADTFMDLANGASVTVLQSIDNYSYKDAPKGRDRMVEFSGEWDLRMLDRNRTQVIYTAYTHPGGFAPRGIVNGIIRKVSFNSTRGLIEKAKNKNYYELAQNSEAKKDIEKAIQEGRLKYSAAAK